MMNKRPRSITAIGWMFIVAGVVALASSLLPAGNPAMSGEIGARDGRGFAELGMASITRVLAVLGGAFLLRGFNWARWLLVAWMGFHIVLSVLHTPFEMLVHSLIFAAVSYFLFRSEATAYFGDVRGASEVRGPGYR